MLKLVNLSCDYHDIHGKKEVLKNINLEINRGEIVGLFGENGAGKTTLMKSVLQILKYKGEVLLDNEQVGKKNMEKLSFGTCEHTFFPGLTPELHKEFYEMYFENFKENRFEALMEFFELPRKKPIRSYSTGQKNQFEVVLALCQGADYIFLDEPFAGNDIFNREDFYKVLLGILEPNETIIISTHLIEEVENFISRAVLIRKGEIVGDTTILDLEEQGEKLIDYIKERYEYKNRVNKVIDTLNGGEAL